MRNETIHIEILGDRYIITFHSGARKIAISTQEVLEEMLWFCEMRSPKYILNDYGEVIILREKVGKTS